MLKKELTKLEAEELQASIFLARATCAGCEQLMSAGANSEEHGGFICYRCIDHAQFKEERERAAKERADYLASITAKGETA